VLTRIGLNEPEKKYLEVLNKIMEMSVFQGLIGGKPEKALYFVGKHNNEYIYLDPHYVQGS
jgi:cysteine protease ATG4